MKNIYSIVLLFFTCLLVGQNLEKKVTRYIDKKQYKEAADFLYKEKGEVLYQSNPKDIYKDIIVLLDLEGQVFLADEKYSEAKVSYQEGYDYLTKKVKLYPKSITSQEINVLDNYANLNMETGSIWFAGQLLKLSDSLRQEFGKKKENQRSLHAFYFAKYNYLLNNLDDASSLFLKYINYVTKLSDYSPNELMCVAKSYNYLSSIETLKNQPWEALKYAKKANFYSNYSLVRRKIKTSEAVEVISQNNMSAAYLRIGNLEEAKKYSDNALRLFTQEKLDTSYSFLDIWLTRGEILWQFGLDKDAHHCFQEANKIQLDYVKRILPTLSEQEKEKFYFGLVENTNLFYVFCADYLPKMNSELDRIALLKELLDLRINTKAKVMSESGKMMQVVQSSDDPELKFVYNRLKEKKNQYALYNNQNEKSTNELEDLSAEIATLEKKLIDILHSDGIKIESSMTYIREIPNYMSNNSIAVEIIRIPSYTAPKMLSSKELKTFVKDTSKILNSRLSYDNPKYLFVKIDKKSALDYTIIDGHDLENKYYSYYANGNKFKKEDNISHKKYILPFEKWLPQEGDFYLSGDGIYNQINLSIIKNPSTGRFFIEDHKVFNISNLDELTRPSALKFEIKDAFLIGRPAYSLTQTYTSDSSIAYVGSRGIEDFHSYEIADLVATEKEVNYISSLLEKDSIKVDKILGKEASESALKNHPSASILHIATHGFWVNDTNDEINPMMKSGLLFSGVSDYDGLSEDDGILTAYEASNIDLKNTELVILSACETGLGEIKDGEGVYGLQRAFQIAGVNYVMMSMWKVDDEATMVLMNAFYTYLNENKNVALSFQKAQLQVKESYPHPYYWGAFKLVGF